MKKISAIILIMLLGFSTTLLAAPSSYSNRSNDIKVNRDAAMRFSIALAQIKKFYASDVDDEELFANAIKGMLSGLDPHSMYLDKEALKNLKDMTDGNYAGVGIVLSQKKNLPIVVSPIDGSPADKAGIQAGDYILAVDGKRTDKMPINKLSELIRGKPGTKVTLVVFNEKTKKIKKVEITRKKVDIKNIRYRLLPDNYAYIRIMQFQKDTAKDLLSAIKVLKAQSNNHLQGIILDLRNNPGGLLDEAAAVTDVLLDKNKLPRDRTIVYTKQRSGKVGMRLKAKTGDSSGGIPIVVLINSGSASASEIVAGALQDYKRAIVVGEPSFGKGSVQALLALDNDTAIKLTTSLYYTPKGRSIQETGIRPDIMVENLTIKTKSADDNAIAFLTGLREKDIDGHIENINKKATVEQNNLPKEDKDYQLREALNIIRTIKLIRTNKAYHTA